MRGSGARSGASPVVVLPVWLAGDGQTVGVRTAIAGKDRTRDADEITVRRLPATTVGSRFSYSGSARRISSATRSWRAGGWRSVIGYSGMVVLIGFAWVAVTAWYAVILAVVGPIVAPFWLIRWADRRREFREQQEDAALLRMMTGGSKNDLQ